MESRASSWRFWTAGSEKAGLERKTLNTPHGLLLPRPSSPSCVSLRAPSRRSPRSAHPDELSPPTSSPSRAARPAGFHWDERPQGRGFVLSTAAPNTQEGPNHQALEKRGNLEAAHREMTVVATEVESSSRAATGRRGSRAQPWGTRVQEPRVTGTK